MNPTSVFRLILASFITWTASAIHAQVDENGWTLQRDENGIKVYTRNIDGNILDEYKASTVVYNIPIDSIYGLIIGGYGARLSARDPLVMKYDVLKVGENGEYYSYMELKTPFLIKDRDIIFRVNSRKTTHGYVLEGHSVPTYIPEKPGFVRMGEGRTYYFLTRRADGGVDVIVTGRMNLGGDMPEKVVNKSIVASTYERLVFIREQINSIIADGPSDK